MLENSNFIVSHTQHKNCFCSINSNNFMSSNTNVCLKVSWDNSSIILWPNFSPFPIGKIGINGQYAKILNLFEDTAVHVTTVQLPPVNNKVLFKPTSEEDWVILEANSEKLQYSLLDQIRVVSPNQKLVLWVSPSLSICVTSENYGILEKHCEIEVEPFVRDSTSGIKSNINHVPKSLSKTPISSIENKTIQSLSQFPAPSNCFCLTAIIANIEFTEKYVYHPFIVYATKAVLEYYNIDLKSPFYTLIGLEKEPEKVGSDNDDNAVHRQNDCYDLVVEFKEITRNVPKKYCKFGLQAVFVSDAMNKIINIETGKKLFFENTRISSNIDSLEIIPVKLKEECSLLEFDDLAENFKSYVIDCEKTENGFIINNGIIINISKISCYPLQLNLLPNALKAVLVTTETIRNCKMITNSIKNVSYTPNFTTSKNIDIEDLSRRIKSFEKLILKCLSSIHYHLQIKQNQLRKDLQNKWHFILSGAAGSGKSTICDIIAAESGLWHFKINCRTLKGKKDVQDVFNKAFKVCQEYSPSILICDDIDSLIPAEVEGTSNQDITHYEKLTSLLKNMMLDADSVFVIMTAQEVGSVNTRITQSKGDCVFTMHLTITELDEVDRCEILQLLMKQRIHGILNVKKLDLRGCVSETVGYRMKDMVEYVDKKIFNLMKDSEPHTDLNDILSAINSDKAAEKDSHADVWDDIGGLKSVKESLIESICWPLMYPALFPPQCGGTLLYGPPGTGKSLIGSCVARLSSMSFISVKGPELLSKYIGQSEMAVRNIFLKARKKSPCILFFDEFDSLAPSRGHDSTGVTDRVVNQLLTQMDGVEGAIRGVIIMAATSRPDLIDAALLRPGRFGNTLYCRMPDEDDRLEILITLSKSVDLADDVDLAEVARKTIGFSGADLKAVLVTAQLMTLEKQISENNELNSMIPISSQFISMALDDTKPSLSADKLMFYEKIYARFNRDPRLSTQKHNDFQASGILSTPRAVLA